MHFGARTSRLPPPTSVLVTVVASRVAFGVAYDRFATLDATTAPQGFGGCE